MNKDNRFWVNAGYVVTALLVGLIFFKATELVAIGMGWRDRFIEWFAQVQWAVAVFSGSATIYWITRDKAKDLYFEESVAEIRKVQWPTASETKNMTWIVCVFVVIVALILFGFDFVWSSALKFIVS